MDFIKRLRPGVQRGEITCSIRIWQSPRVKAGNRYGSTGVGQIEVDSIEPIELSDITPELARESGFNGVVDLLKIAKHGSGTNVYLVRFHYIRPGTTAAKGKRAKAAARKAPERRQAAQAHREFRRGLPEGEANRRPAHESGSAQEALRLVHDRPSRRRPRRSQLQGVREMHDILQQLMPEHFHVPKYMGKKGWVGLWLDLPKLDWAALRWPCVARTRASRRRSCSVSASD